MPEIQLKYPLPDHLHSFQSMIDLARSALKKESDHTSAIVLAVRDFEYCFLDPAGDRFAAHIKNIKTVLKSNGNTHISKIVCMWNDGTIEVPSYSFRDMLCRLNSNNLSTEILVTGEQGYFAVELGCTLYRDHDGE